MSKNNLKYEVQYSQNKEKLWDHCSSGETVVRYDTRFGMDIHHTIEEQQSGKPTCYNCTHGKSNQHEFDEFCKIANELWGVVIDKSEIQF